MKTNTITTIVRVGVVAFSLAACSKSEAPKTKVESPTPKISERTEPPKPPQPQQPKPPTLDQEALALAGKAFSEKLTKVGDSWFVFYQSRVQVDANFGSQFIQFKGVTLQVTPLGLSEADRLNGLQWQAQVKVSDRAYRSYRPDEQTPQWSDWETETWTHHYSLDSMNYVLTKKNDQWTNNAVTKTTAWPYSEEQPGVFFKLTKPSEEQIMNILTP